MSGPSKVIVVEPDSRAARQIQLGFEREGIPTLVTQVPADPATLELDPEADPALLIVGGAETRGLDLVRRAKALRDSTRTDAPIVFAGRGVSRADAEAAGADEIVMRPAYLRDLVTVGRLLRGVPADQRDHLVGSLVETTGVYTLVRALATLGRSATLTLIRGLRRGEIRFYRGEVTSASLALIHGQAAFHQLLLWTDARFDFAREDIVRRQQIPLSSDELFADAERFLERVREAAGRLSPATVLEQSSARVQELGKQIPPEVVGVLRMFDGHRVLADILEDSPYRVFETLRVAQKAVEAGLLHTVEAQRAKTTWRAVLAIEEWLVGDESRDAVVERTSLLDTNPDLSSRHRKTRPKRRRSASQASGVPSTQREAKSGKIEIDWGALVPRAIGAEMGPLSGVVPAMASVGEIEVASRSVPREGLETMDTDKRQRIFPTDIGLEPSVVVPGDTDEWERVEWEAKARTLAQEKQAATAAHSPDAAQAKVREAVERMRQSRAAVEAAEARAKQAAEQAPDSLPASTTVEGGALSIAASAAPPPITAALPITAAPPAPPITAAPALAASVAPPASAPVVAKTPVSGDQSPSDGVVRATFATADSGQSDRDLPARPPDRPGRDAPAITAATASKERAAAASGAATDEASRLVADLAAAHSAMTSAFTKIDATPPGDSATPSRELAVAEVREDAAHFSELEEAFFTKSEHAPPPAMVSPESFDDLDEGYEPPRFWDRVFGRHKRPITASPVDKPKK
jgi:hypothetical protein